MTETGRARLAVLASGNGSNLQAVLDATRTCVVEAEVALVVSHDAGAVALDRARAAGVPAVAIPLANHRDRAARACLEDQILTLLDTYGVDLVVLAGWMLILSPGFLQRCRHPVLNVHPALLPLDGTTWTGDIPVLRGAHAVREALALDLPYTGVSVHHVVAAVDSGPVILQEAVPVLAGDTEASLHTRIKGVEHRLLPQAISLVLQSVHSGEVYA